MNKTKREQLDAAIAHEVRGDELRQRELESEIREQQYATAYGKAKAKKAAKKAARQRRRAVQVGDRPTVADRKAELAKVKAIERKDVVPQRMAIAASKLEQMVLKEQRERKQRQAAAKAASRKATMRGVGQVTAEELRRVAMVPSGVAPVPERDQRAVMDQALMQMVGLTGPFMIEAVRKMKRILRDRAMDACEKVVVGREYEWVRKTGKEPVLVTKKSKSKVRVLCSDGRERKVSALTLVLDQTYVPATVRVGREELKTVVARASRQMVNVLAREVAAPDREEYRERAKRYASLREGSIAKTAVPVTAAVVQQIAAEVFGTAEQRAAAQVSKAALEDMKQAARSVGAMAYALRDLTIRMGRR